MELFGRIVGRRDIWLSFLLNMVLVILLFFFSVFAGLYLSNQDLIQQELLARGRAFFRTILVTRDWNAGYGGVYVEKRPGVASSPYLTHPDITSTEGKAYTLKNPAMMIREISELARGKGRFEFHITSLDPLNPRNAADAVERKALKAFEGGVKEMYAERTINGSSYYWYMAPLYIEKSCLRCHAEQGYQVEDVRGGISVMFNTDRIKRRLAYTHWLAVVLFMLSTAVLLVIVYRLTRGLTRTIGEDEAQLRRIATTDSLTGLYNRRYLNDRLGNEVQRARRYQYPLSCIMFDIDRFKEVNDSYGHDAGDLVLKGIATLAGEVCREADIVTRYGGEEFVLILPNTDRVAAHAVAEKLRAALEATPIAIFAKTHISITASFGVAELPTDIPAEEYDYSQLISAADGALYVAKESGRNRVVDA